LKSVRVVRGAPTVLLPASSEASSFSKRQRLASFAGLVGSAALGRKRVSIKCWVLMSAVYSSCPMSFRPAGLGCLNLSPVLVVLEGFHCSLRRCTCGGIIGLPLFGVGPSFEGMKTGSRRWQGSCVVPAQQEQEASASFGVCRLTNRCSGPGPIKCLAAGVDGASASQYSRARVLTRQLAAAELGR
jgi:hypothetical protein